MALGFPRKSCWNGGGLMILYLSGCDIYTLSSALERDAGMRDAMRSFRTAIKKTGLLYSYHYLGPHAPMEMQLLAWNFLYHGAAPKKRDETKRRTRRKNEDQQRDAASTLERSKTGFGF
jgi:hypothetical protein